MKIIKVYGRVLLLFCLWLTCTASICHGKGLSRVMAEHLRCYPVSLLSFKEQKPLIVKKNICLAAIYHNAGAQPLWVSEQGPGTRAEVIFGYLKNAGDEGLDPADYQVEKINALWTDPRLESLAELDTLLTYNMVKYVHDVSYGQLKAYMANPKLFPEAGDREFDPLATVETIRRTENLDDFFHSLPPRHRQYRGLKKWLVRYSRITYEGHWQPLSLKKSISPGDENPKIDEIRKRIVLLENGKEQTPGAHNRSAIFDDKLKKKVILFQKHHGLKPDGIIGRRTLRELNRSPGERVARIKINMARWRWQDHSLGDTYILVNIANFRLYAHEAGALKFSIPVIVGKRRHQTPVFSDKIKYLELNPYWNVPVSIAVSEELPELIKNPNHLVKKNIRLFSNWQRDGVELDSTAIDWPRVTPSQMAAFKLRQDPGPANALGRIKFVFPNHYAVYLHDTPSKSLFSRQERSFSHGCIRVSEPSKLAAFLLNKRENDQTEWNIKKVKALIYQGQRKVFQIRPPIPVHITYQTAWVDKTDQIIFNMDLYGRDEKLHKALFTQ